MGFPMMPRPIKPITGFAIASSFQLFWRSRLYYSQVADGINQTPYFKVVAILGQPIIDLCLIWNTGQLLTEISASLVQFRAAIVGITFAL